MRFTRRQIAALLIVGCCCIGIIGATLFLVSRIYRQNWWVEHTLSVITEGQQALTCLLDCETAARGYMLTGEKQFLEPYETCYRHVAGHLEKLKNLTGDNPIQQASMPKLFTLAQEKIKYSQQMISSRDTVKSGGPLAITSMQPDKLIMDQFRQILGQIVEREQSLLAERKARVDRFAQYVYFFVAFLSLFLLSILVLTLLIAAQENKTKVELAESKSQLHSSREAFDAVVSRVKDYAIFLLDPAGNILTWNEGAQRIKGYSADEIIGKNFSIFYSPAAQETQYPARELKEAIDKGHYEEEGWRVRKDGSRFWATVTITPTTDENGTVTGFIKVTRDLTERKNTEEKLSRYAKEAELARDEAIKADALKSTFVANVSHEIRTPLSGVVGMAELLTLEPKLSEVDSNDLANKLFASSKQLLEVLNDLLDFSKLEAGRIQIEKIPFRLKNVMDEVFWLSQPRSLQKDLALDMRFDKTLPSSIIGDPGRIRQVLINLVHNAIKFTARGGVEIAVEKRDHKVYFSVTDTGIGIPQDIQPNLFKPFVQADASTTRKFGGTGLGLSIAKQYVELMGGEIEVFSEPGKGSTFGFSMPLVEAGEEQ